MQQLKQRSAFRILRTLQNHTEHPWCNRVLARLHLPATVHDHSTYRVGQRRFHPFNVYTEKKHREKLIYMHNNPVKRGLGGASWRLAVVQLEVLLSRRYLTISDGSIAFPKHQAAGLRRPAPAGPPA